MVEPSNSLSFSAIKHSNLKRVVTLYSPVLAGYNGNEVVSRVKQSISNYDGISPNIELNFTGEIEEQGKNMRFLTGALLAALGMIVFLLVLQFNSISNPLIILLLSLIHI